MILIVGQLQDRCVQLVHDRLAKRGIDVVVLDADSPLEELGLSLTTGGTTADSLRLRYRGRDVLSSSLAGVLYLADDPFRINTRLDREDQAYARSELDATLAAFLSMLPCPVVNRPRIPGTPLLLTPTGRSMVRSAGMSCSEFHISCDREPALMFYQRCPFGALVWSDGRRHLLPRENGLGAFTSLVDEGPICAVELPSLSLRRHFVVGQREVGACATGSRLCGLLPPPDSRVTACCEDLAGQLEADFAEILVAEADNVAPFCLDVVTRPNLEQCDDALRELLTDSLSALVGGE